VTHGYWLRSVQPLEQLDEVVSALDLDSLEPLRETLKARMRARLSRVRVRLPSRDGEALATLYREGEVLERTDEGRSITVIVRLPSPALGRIRGREGIEVEAVS